MGLAQKLIIAMAAAVLVPMPVSAQTEESVRPVDIAPSQVLLGPSRITPDPTIKVDSAKAEEHYRQGHDALNAKDYDKAREAFRIACAEGHGGSCFNAGLLVEEAAKAELAKQATAKPKASGKTAADANDAVDENAEVPVRPVLVAEKDGTAADYYQRSCNLNFARGCTLYGILLKAGDVGLEADPATAVALFRGACDESESSGCQNLAEALYSGQGVAQNKSEAAANFRKSCELGGLGVTCFNYGLMREKGEGIDADAAEALDYYRKACSRKNAEGCTNLAVFYANGQGVPQDLELAVGFFTEGCNNGNATACSNLAYVSRTGKGTVKDIEKALNLYRQGCDKGEGAACYGLGQMAMDREPGAGGRSKAYPSFVKGCNLGDAQSCYNAGLTRWIGFGTNDNLEEGYAWFTKGCEMKDAGSCGGAALLSISYTRDANDEPRKISAEERATAMRWLAQGKSINSENVLVKAVEEWLTAPNAGAGAALNPPPLSVR